VRLEYDATGQLIDLRCGDSPKLDVDRQPCGFAGRSTVRFAAKRGGVTRTMQYLNGKLDGTVREGDDATVTNERDYAAGELREERVGVAGALRVVFRKGPGADDSERFTHYDDGRPKAHTIARAGRVTGYESWWQNGLPKIQATLGERDTAQVRSFHDDGKPHETYAGRLRRLDRSLEAYFETNGDYRSLTRDGKALMTGRYERNRFVGEVNDYDEAGLLRRRTQLDPDGARRRIEFDERGQQVSDQSFFADGSRKP
jgi:antitoxin component YwqK of YwqJK toxin-antitoxin module